MTDPRWDDMADRLEVIAEEVGDLGAEYIRTALALGATQRPDADRVLARVRRSIDKAVHLLRSHQPSSE